MNFFRTTNGTPVPPQGYIPAQSCKPANAPAMPAPQASYRTAANPFAQPAVQPAMPYPGAYAPQPPAGAPHAPQSPGFPNAPQAPQPPLGGIPAGAPMNVAATHTNDASVEAWFGAKFLGVVAAILLQAVQLRQRPLDHGALPGPGGLHAFIGPPHQPRLRQGQGDDRVLVGQPRL